MLLKDATLVALDPPAVERGDLRVEGDAIAERGRALCARPAEEVLDLAGGLVLPGLVNAHTHLYSALARGMPAPAAPPRSFLEILERVWWRLDRALDAESVALSGLVGAAEAALSGTTLLVDHHSSPSFIRGSLAALRQSVEAVGLRAVLCYEVTDRNGTDGREQGLRENRAFLASGPTALTRGMVGAHASFTLSEDALAQLGALVGETGAGLHVHVGEDALDRRDCRERFGESLPGRLERHGLVGPGALFAHCVHLEPGELERVQDRGAFLALNPRSNRNNGVGRAPTSALRRAALGTDGIDEDMLAEARAAFLGMREGGRGDAQAAAIGLLAGGHRLASELFGVPFGRLHAGAPADLLVLDYRPPTPLSSENLGAHLLFGVDRSHVRSVLVAGCWVVRDRVLTSVDAGRVFAQARSAAEALWRRMEQ
jgi:putative selenium metabolism protein SsnA